MPIVAPAERVESALANLPDRRAAEIRSVLEWTAEFTELDTELELSRHGLQRFIWYALPRKWSHSENEQAALLDDLASLVRSLDPVLGPSYAELCTAQATRALLHLYATDDDDAAIEEFARMETASGVQAPDTQTLSWGAVMGIDEAVLRDRAASALEAAMELGDFTPGERGWQSAQEKALERFLQLPREDLDGRTPLETIRAERSERWRSSRREHHATMATKVWARVEAAAAEPLSEERAAEVAEPLRWLLSTALERDGLKLTATGALSRALVREVAERFPTWWEAELFGPPYREADLSVLQELHDLARRAKLLRPRRERLLITPAGRTCLADPAGFGDIAARELLGEDFGAALAEPMLASFLRHGEADAERLAAEAHPIVVEAGWSQTGEASIELEVIRWEIYPQLRRFEALEVVQRPDRRGPFVLTEGGRWLAARALWLCATAPRGWV